MDLFDHAREQELSDKAPLAARMRPRTLDEFAGQAQILGAGRLLRRAIQADQLSSLIFYGPPGTGKTTLARIIANTTRAHFDAINAVLAGVGDIRRAVADAEQRLGQHGLRTILFVDEVHRFNKSQQDALLPHVEFGTVILIGATTENPYFEVNKTVLSRSRIFELRSLEEADLRVIIQHALEDNERGYGRRNVSLTSEAADHLARVANGDARAVLNALELAVETTPPDKQGRISINLEVMEESIQRKAVLYDKEGDAHFDTISAFIKSLRGSDPDAALYWMAQMVYAGEDPRFLLRRMLIFAAEDVGLADPAALGMVAGAAQAFDYVGLPEGRFHLAQACLYLATAPKSNSAFAFFDALDAVEQERSGEVPNHLKDANRDGEGLGHGKGYMYPHAYRDHWVAQQYLPDNLQGKVFYEPGNTGFEAQLAGRVSRLREAQLAAMSEAPASLEGHFAGFSPANETPAGFSPANETPAGFSPANETPAGFSPANDTPAGFSPANETPAGFTSAQETPAGRTSPDCMAAEGSQKAPSAHQEWQLRSQGNLGTHLEALREKAFALAEIGRQHLVLDANAGTGLLTWEAVRLATEGGVWALAEDGPRATALSERARQMPTLNAPVVLQGALDDLPELVAGQADGEVRFDRVLARNVLGRASDKAPRIALLAGLLAPGGRLVLVEPVPRLGERLLAAQNWSGLPAAMAKRVLEAEEAIYADAEDPMVNWDDGDLASWCREAGLTLLSKEVAGSMVEFPVAQGLLERWFGQGGDKDGDKGGEQTGPGKLGALLGKDAERVRRHLEQSMAGGAMAGKAMAGKAMAGKAMAGRALRRKIAVAFMVAERSR